MIKIITDTNGNKHEIYIDDDLAFLAPYLTVAKKVGIPVWRVKEIKGYYVQPDKIERQAAAAIRSDESPNKKLIITILKHSQLLQSKRGRFEVIGYSPPDDPSRFEDILDTLAHELAHVVHWEHTADRYVLEKKIQLAFSYRARRRGYRGY